MRSRQAQFGILIICINVLFRTVTSFTIGIGWFGQPIRTNAHNSDHYRITTCAIYKIAIKYLEIVYYQHDLDIDLEANGGTCRDMHMFITKAIAKFNAGPTYFRLAHEQIAMSNIITDSIYDWTPYTHFDNEEFENGAKFVTMLFQAVQSSLKRGEWANARMCFGYMSHTLQDFYSHSNWIELGMKEPNRDLAHGRRLGSVADKSIETCKSCDGTDEDCVRNNLIQNQYLTSGYFSYYYPVPKPSGKCNHGFTCIFDGDKNEYCEGISKDLSTAPHGHLHLKAASVAYDATVNVLNEVWELTSTEVFGKFLGLANSFSVVFVIDISEDLHSVVDMIEDITSQLVDKIENISIKPSNYILSPFNGTHWGTIHTVTTIDAFLNLIKNLDEKDLQYPSINYYDALNEAIKIAESNSLVFFFTDAPQHERCSHGPTRALARLKQVKIDVLFVDSYRSNSETIKELIHFTDITGGLFLKMNTKQVKPNGNFIRYRLQEVFGYECILYESMSHHHQGTFMVDATATLLRINVISSSSSLIFRLKHPKNSNFQVTPSSESDYLQMFTIDLTSKSDVGRWIYTCSDDCVVEVNVKSTARCRTQVSARLNDDFGELIVTPPLVNQTEVLAITTCDNSNVAITNFLELIGTNGEVISKYSPKPHQAIEINTPSQSFRIRTFTKFDEDTFIYREERALIDTSRIVMVIYNQPLIVIADEQLNLTFSIRNEADKDLYVQLDINSVLKYSKWYSIDAKSTRNESITINKNIYRLKDENVRFIPLLFTLQAFETKTELIFDNILYRHEQIVPLYLLASEIELQDPTHFVKNS